MAGARVRSGEGWLRGVDDAGQPLRPERWSDTWTQLCAEADIRPLTRHSAGHTSVTQMRSRGVPDR